jgi:predicted transcriptional regulator
MAKTEINEFTDGLNDFSLQKYLYEREGLDKHELAVALALLYHRNNVTLLCRPSIETLAKDTRLSKSAVQRALNGLKTKHIILVKSTWTRNGRQVNDYLFLYDAGDFLEIMKEGRACHDLSSAAEELLEEARHKPKSQGV